MKIPGWSAERKALEKRALTQIDSTQHLEELDCNQKLEQKLDSFCGQRGVDLNERPENLERMSLGGRGFDRVQKKVMVTVDRLLEDDGDRRDVKNFVNRYSQNLRDSFAEKNGGRHMSASDAYGLLVRNVAKLALQEHAATECLLGHHGIEHIVTHNMRVAQTLFRKLQENGCQITATDRLLIDQAMIDHDIGYALIADDVRERGLQGQEHSHPVVAAKLVRESRGHSPLDSIFDESDWSGYHQAVLRHAAPDKEQHLGFLLVDSPDPQQRNHNLEVAVRLADTSHALDEHKLPPLILDHPQTLSTLRLIQTAGELNRPDLIKLAQQNLQREIQSRCDLSATKKEAFQHAARHAAPISVTFLVGRFEADVEQSEEISDGRVTFLNKGNPVRGLVHEFFRIDTPGSQLEKLQDETGAAARDDIQYEVKSQNERVPYPKTDFQAQVRTLLTDTPIAAFHRIDSALARNGNSVARESHLEQYLRRQELAFNGFSQPPLAS
jgi:hypothetical protein